MSDRHPAITGDAPVRRLQAEHDAWREAGYAGPCPVREALDRIGDRWSVLVMLRLGAGPTRFRQLLRAVEGVSQRMLTVTLRGLERDGLVTRRVLDTRPPSVEYALTATGASLLPVLAALADWASRNAPAMLRARAAFDGREG